MFLSKNLIIYSLTLLLPALVVAQSTRNFRGHISSEKTKEAIANATVYCFESANGVQTDRSGNFSIQLPQTDITLLVQHLGYEDQMVMLASDVHELTIQLSTEVNELREVVVEDVKSLEKELVHRPESGVMKMNMKEIQALPSIGGEVDIMKAVQLLPGVTQGGEGSTNLFVRGGDADQNLILYDDVTLYSVSHLFGFFSVFNPDVLSDVTIYKGGFPARYGGRLSSILDIQTKSPNLERWGGSFGVGLLSSRLMLEGPVIPGKVSVMMAARRAYIDKAFKAVGLDLPYHFYDLNLRIDAIISTKDRLSLSAYRGYDVLSLAESTDSTGDQPGMTEVDFGFRIGNYGAGATWRHLFNDRWMSRVHFGVTSFNYRVGGGNEESSVFVSSEIQDFDFRPELVYQLDHETKFTVGLQATKHAFRPNIIEGGGVTLEGFPNEYKGEPMSTFEGGVYVHLDREMPQLRSRIGLAMRQSLAITKGASYMGPEPRMNYRYLLLENTALKASYALMRQYLHRVSSSNVILPTDLWYPVSARVLPQRSHQWGASIEQAIPKWSLLLSVEGYVKTMSNLTEYREGANLIMNNNFEDELLQGDGLSRGLEFLVKRSEGRFSGWLGYTLSKTDRQFDEINNGEWFPAKYDRRHDFSAVASFKVTPRLTLATTFVYLSGARFTALLGNHIAFNPLTGQIEAIPIYSKRNEIRLSDSHRLDVNIQIGPKPDSKKLLKGTFNVGAYNVYARALPYRVNLTPTEQGKFKYTQPGLFGFIFNISYELKF